MEPKKKMVEKEETKETDDDGKTSGKTTRGYNDGSVHITTFVDIPDVGSLRSSYDLDSDGNPSDQHFVEQ